MVKSCRDLEIRQKTIERGLNNYHYLSFGPQGEILVSIEERKLIFNRLQ